MTARRALVWIHRWTGLVMAGFLALEGLTGSILAFQDSLERWVIPTLFATPQPAVAPLGLADLAVRAETLVPEARVAYFWVQDRRAIMRLEPRVDPLTGAPYKLLFDHLFLDPWTGQELGRRREGDLSQGRINLIPFIHRLHTDLALGEPGILCLGIVALAWTIDCFVGFWLTLPVTLSRILKRWKLAWLVRLQAQAIRVNFDIHRASGLWLWPLLFVFAWSSVMFDLPQVYEPVTQALFDYRSDLDLPRSLDLHPNPSPRLSWSAAERIGAAQMASEAIRRGFRVDRPHGMAYIEQWGVYTYSVQSSVNIEAGGWNTSLWIDGNSGALLYVELPEDQPVGNSIGTWLRALHFADLHDSLPYRWLVAFVGLATATLSLTGVYIWWRKRRARELARRMHARVSRDFNSDTG